MRSTDGRRGTPRWECRGVVDGCPPCVAARAGSLVFLVRGPFDRHLRAQFKVVHEVRLDPGVGPVARAGAEPRTSGGKGPRGPPPKPTDVGSFVGMGRTATRVLWSRKGRDDVV